MTVQDLQRASDEVRELLTKSYDLKLQRGGTADATQFASTAFEKASDLPRTWSHWRQLAAYRLAHLLLRQDGPLDEIDTFLSIAEGADFLEPLRSFCYLAVLHRIRACQKTAVDRKAVTARIGTAFSIATGYVQQAATPRGGTEVTRYLAQEPSFNTLELLSYALDLPYKSLEGITRKSDFCPFGDRDRSSRIHAWQILGAKYKSVWMTEEFARRELASRASDGSCIKVEITRNHSRWAFQTDQEAGLEVMPEHSDRLIVALLDNPEITSNDLRRKVVGDSESKAHFRKVKQRTQDGIRFLTGNDALDAFPRQPGSRDRIELTDKIDFLVLRTA
jgi:hypothetical protein